MIFISTRKELDNEDELGPTSFWNLEVDRQVENAAQRTELHESEFVSSLEGKSVLILVHGFNNEFEDIVRAYDMIRENMVEHLGDWYDEIIGFTWPGGDSPLDWYAPKRRAGVVAPRLANVISLLEPHAESIDTMSHSLGARVVLGALQNLVGQPVRANFMTAAAVDNEVIEIGEKYYVGVKEGAAETVVFHSKYDQVLKSAYRLAEWDNPLGLFGPENPGSVIEHLPNVYVANCKRVIKGHGEYKNCDAIYEFIAKWMEGEIETQFSTI